MEEEQKMFAGFTEDAKSVLRKFSWPGNVIQLQNLIHSCVVMNDGPLLSGAMLASQLPKLQEKIASLTPSVDKNQENILPTASISELPLSEGSIEPLADIERKAIQSAIAYYEDNVVKAASALGVSPSTLYRKIQQW